MTKDKQHKASKSRKAGSLQARMAVSYFVTTALFNALFIGLILLVLLVTDVEINRKVLAIVCIVDILDAQLNEPISQRQRDFLPRGNDVMRSRARWFIPSCRDHVFTQ